MKNEHEEARTMKSKLIVFVGLAFLVAFVLAGAGQQNAEQLYKSGLYEEEVGGDLQKAIGIYQDILKRFPDNRGIAAKAQLHIGLCYDKLGTSEAEKAFQKVIDNYPEQSEAVREAKEKLSLLLRSRALIKTGDAEFKLRQVWSGAGVDILGAVSPDGRYLSFVDWVTGDLAIREIATGTNRRLTNKGSWQQSPEFALFSEWSPDSRRIVYQWYNKDESFELRVFDIQDSTARTLFQSREKTEYAQAFDWSPDGKSILAAIYGVADSAVGRIVQLSLIPVDGGPVKVLKTQSDVNSSAGWGFAFSPDGKYIAFDIQQKDKTERRDIFLLSADGNTETSLTEHPANDTLIGWTPDGEGLLFNSDRTGTQDMWFVRVTGGKPQGDPQLLKPSVGRIEPMGVTSRGALFYGISGGGTDVYEVGIDPQTGKISSPAKKAVLLYEGHNAYPDYSPDGKLLAYISSPGMPTLRPQKFLGILSLETGQSRELRPDLDLATFGYPRWAPDGRSISVEGSGRDGRKGIYRVDIQSVDVVPIVLIDKGKEIYSHRWSKDGKLMFYSTGDRAGKAGSIFVHNFETGQEEPIAGSPSNAQFFDISPDGKWLALLNRDAQRVISIMPASGGKPREIYRFEQGGNFVITPAWSADGHYIYFSKLQKPQGQGNLWDLYRVSIDGGEAQKINLSMAQLRHYSVHPDGQRIAFSSLGTYPPQSQVWVMENFLPADKAKK
jgi:Tol biopolymer transport system component